MATSSILGGSKAPGEITGKDMQALGTGDNSDSGSDTVGAYSADELASDGDSTGTGERAALDKDLIEPDADILPDHIDSGLGAASDDEEAALNDEGSDTQDDLSGLDGLDDIDDLTDISEDPADGLDDER